MTQGVGLTGLSMIDGATALNNGGYGTLAALPSGAGLRTGAYERCAPIPRFLQTQLRSEYVAKTPQGSLLLKVNDYDFLNEPRRNHPKVVDTSTLFDSGPYGASGDRSHEKHRKPNKRDVTRETQRGIL